jgi:hypothetical protein
LPQYPKKPKRCWSDADDAKADLSPPAPIFGKKRGGVGEICELTISRHASGKEVAAAKRQNGKENYPGQQGAPSRSGRKIVCYSSSGATSQRLKGNVAPNLALKK